MTEISELSAGERAKRCRELACEARYKASECSGEKQQAFVRSAGQLQHLALEADCDAADETEDHFKNQA